MQNKLKKVTLTGILAMTLVVSVAGCGGKNKNTESTQASEAVSTEHAQVADKSEMSTVNDVVKEGMTPITAEGINDGTYEIKVESSSSMFKITQCQLTVSNGKMTATMTMGGKGYRYLFMGTGEQAVNAAEEQFIPYVEDAAGAHTFTVPVEALDSGIACTAFSDKKEKWYDRTLCFLADSLPEGALKDVAAGKSVSELNLKDGSYSITATLEGGSGKAKIEAASVKIAEGKAIATITWSSKNYDYMIVDGAKYENINTEGNSVFEIPVLGFDYKMPVKADTTAMGTPHEIEYTITFDSASMQ